MSHKKIHIILLSTIVLSFFQTQAKAEHHHFYAGLSAGYGSTTWDGLVPSAKNQNLALSMSTPIDVTEGGGVWGGLVGYEFSEFFALEANYLHYKSAIVLFDPTSIFSFEHNDSTGFRSETETVRLVAKIMLAIPKSKLRVFSSAGAANVHRDDMLTDRWHVGPTFGVGLNYHFSDQFMGELGGNYTAGFGQSQLSPTDTYIPFLYCATATFAYLF